MDIKDILSVGLTAEDFEKCIEGLNSLPEKGLVDELIQSMMGIMAGAAVSKNRAEEMKNVFVKRFKELGNRAKAQEDDLVILKSKMILLKRLLAGNEAMKMASEILNSTPPHLINQYLGVKYMQLYFAIC